MATYYVYQPNQEHAGPLTVDDVARGVAARKIPNGAQFAAVGDTKWAPIEAFEELVVAVAALNGDPGPGRPPMRTLVPADPGPRSVPPPPRKDGHPRVIISRPPTAPVPPMPVSERGTSAPPRRDDPSFVIPEAPATDKGMSQPPEPSAEAAPVATPISTAPAPVPASAPAPEANAGEKKEAKKEEAPKPPPLDPKYKKLPLLVFGGFAIIALFEIVIAAAVSKPPPRDPAALVGTVDKPAP
jgi:hypothetical protein